MKIGLQESEQGDLTPWSYIDTDIGIQESVTKGPDPIVIQIQI